MSKVVLNTANYGLDGMVWIEELFTEHGQILNKSGHYVELEIGPAKNERTGASMAKTYRPEHVGILTMYTYTNATFGRPILCAINVDVQS